MCTRAALVRALCVAIILGASAAPFSRALPATSAPALAARVDVVTHTDGAILDFNALNRDAFYRSLYTPARCFSHAYTFGRHPTPLLGAYRVGALRGCRDGSDADAFFNEYSANDTATAQAALNAFQHPPDCSARSHGHIVDFHVAGFASTVHFYMYTFLRTIGAARVAHLAPASIVARPWGWAPSDCAGGSPDCFFEPITNCSANATIATAERYMVAYPPSPDDRNTILDGAALATHLGSKKSWSWVRAQALRYLLRPNAATAAHAEAFARATFPRGLPRPLAAVFVRGTDKGTESPVFNVSAHFAALEPLATSIGLRDVYLNSDSDASIEEARRLFGHRYRLHVPSVERDVGQVHKGDANGVRIYVGMTPAQKAAQVRDTLADIYLSASADVHVGTLSSNRCRIVDALRLAAGKDAFAYVDVDGRYLVEGMRR